MTALELVSTIGRATVFTSVAVLVAMALLKLLRIQSPRVHRVTWLLVVLHGWLLVPWVWQVEAPTAKPANFSIQLEPTAANTSEIRSPAGVHRETQETAREGHYVRMLPAIWFIGIGMTIGASALRYVRFLQQLPASVSMSTFVWQREWERQCRAAGVQRSIDLRMTESLGPLLCFVPFRYLVLVPKPLWTKLVRRERSAILRHELAHLKRGDLWWSLAIRVLALPQWFNPLAWQAVRRFDEAGEWACDDLVSRGRPSRELTFARSLLAAAEYAKSCPPGTVSIQGGELSRRVRRLVSHRFKEEAMIKKFLLLVPLAAIVVVQAVRIERVTAEEPVHASTPPAEKADFEFAPTSPAPHEIPPAYVIEPPDVLSINGIKLIPKPPHKIEPYDGLLIRVSGALPDHPIADAFAVDSDGKVDLGPPYGRVDVAGVTVDEAKSAIENRLQELINNPDVSLSLAFAAAAQKIQGKYLVAPDGRVNLGVYGTVFVAGLTIDEARAAIEKRLSADLRDPQVVVDVVNYNSKKYYVITRHPGRGDNVVTEPITGNDTVLDALALVDDALKQSTTKIWISRPSDHGDGRSKILPVRWDEIVDGSSTATNYQLLPGDRLFVVNTAESTDADAKPAPGPEMPNPIPNYYNMIRKPLNVIAESKSKSVNSVQFNIDMIVDRTGALAEYASGLDGALFVIVDSKTIGPALRVMSKHDLIRKTSSPPLTSRLGETTTVEFNATDVSLTLSARETESGLLVELFLKAKHGVPAQGIDSAASLKPGQMLLLPIPVGQLNAGAAKEADPLYVTITPSLVSNVRVDEPKKE